MLSCLHIYYILNPCVLSIALRGRNKKTRRKCQSCIFVKRRYAESLFCLRQKRLGCYCIMVLPNLILMIYRLRDMIYWLRKHDIISIPSYAEGIYHRAIVRYHIEDISPVPTGTDIIQKRTVVYRQKCVFVVSNLNF